MATNITTDDIRAAGFCVKGLREWSLANGIDLRRLVNGGYTVEEVDHMTDANARRVIDAAKARAEREA